MAGRLWLVAGRPGGQRTSTSSSHQQTTSYHHPRTRGPRTRGRGRTRPSLLCCRPRLASPPLAVPSSSSSPTIPPTLPAAIVSLVDFLSLFAGAAPSSAVLPLGKRCPAPLLCGPKAFEAGTDFLTPAFPSSGTLLRLEGRLLSPGAPWRPCP